jgi:murein DD-endopeptidase MepM/ murein hydrolase activator NlpD
MSLSIAGRASPSPRTTSRAISRTRALHVVLLTALLALLPLGGCVPWGRAQPQGAQQATGGVPVRPLVRAAAAQCALAFTQRLPADPPAHTQRLVLTAMSRLPSPTLDARWPSLSSRLSIALAQSLLPSSPRQQQVAEGVPVQSLAELTSAPRTPRVLNGASAAFPSDLTGQPTKRPPQPQRPQQPKQPQLSESPPMAALAPLPVAQAPRAAELTSARADDSGGLPFSWDLPGDDDDDPHHDHASDDQLDIDLDPESASEVARILLGLQRAHAEAAPDAPAEAAWVLSPPMKSARVTSAFGQRRDPVKRKVTRLHRGVDFGGAVGEPVFAAGPGQVIFVGWAGTAGKAVVIQHPGDVVTHYFHLSRIDVKKDQKVSPGDLIGGVGATGRVTGPHLHFQLTRKGQVVDPLLWIGRSP